MNPAIKMITIVAAALFIGAAAGILLSRLEGPPRHERKTFIQEVECNGVWFEAQVEVLYPTEELCEMLEGKR